MVSRWKRSVTPPLATRLTIPSPTCVRRNQEGMRPGGYGVMLAKNLVDELIYGEKGNEVLLVKYLPGFAPSPA